MSERAGSPEAASAGVPQGPIVEYEVRLLLRLPNLEVARLSANTYAISARGFNGTLADKLLVLIDGRSVYSPLYGGVYWDRQQVLPEDIDRIEVISGPGGTVWGANAVNGVINIITRKSSDTQGGFASLGAGNRDGMGALQYGGRLGAAATYRVYGTGFYGRDSEQASGTSARDGWHKYQAGFRFDRTPATDVVTVEGDAYRGREEQLLTGENLLARWTHRLDGGSLVQVQGYYDETRRFTHDGGGGFALDTYDIELQHSFRLNSWNSIAWGGGERINQWRVLDWWCLSAGLDVQHEKLKFKLGSSRFGGIAQAGDDPDHRMLLRSSMNVSPRIALDAGLREAGKLHDPVVSSYTEVDARIGWDATPWLQFSLAGFDLLRSRHLAFVSPPTANYVARTFVATAQMRF